MTLLQHKQIHDSVKCLCIVLLHVTDAMLSAMNKVIFSRSAFMCIFILMKCNIVSVVVVVVIVTNYLR